jgi:predicted outer membrane repeat protein
MFAGARPTRLAPIRMVAGAIVIAVASLSATAFTAQVASAANDVVSNCSGSGAGSLPAVVAAATSGDTITFSVTCPTSAPITLASTIDIDTNVTIDGPGASELVVSGNNAVEDFDVPSGVTATISGISIEDGNNDDGGGIVNSGTLTVTNSMISGNTSSGLYGGGIYNNEGTLTVTDSTLSNNNAVERGGAIYSIEGNLTIVDTTVSGNTSDLGGGIYNDGMTSITDSTISGNSAEANGGGVYNAGSLEVTESTFSGNSVTSGNSATAGGDVDNNAGSLSLAGTILANGSSGADCYNVSTIVDAGYNLSGDNTCGLSSANHSSPNANAYLGPLNNNGGPTETQAPALGSPALDQIPIGTMANSVSLCPGSDQRGVSRPQGPECDIGAVELVVPRDITSPNNATATVGSTFSFAVTTTGNPVPTVTEKGALPKKLTFTDNGNGTATITGKPKMTGVYHLTIVATFGKGTNKYVVSQAFTLTINSA